MAIGPVGKARSGKGGRVTINAVALYLKEWNVDYKGDDLDTTNFESQGFDQGTIGIIGCDWDSKGDWQAGANFYDNPPGIYPRDDLKTVLLYENVADNVFWNFPWNRVLSAKNGNPVRGLVSFEWSSKTNGMFAAPTGSV